MSNETVSRQFDAWHKREIASLLRAGAVEAADNMQTFRDALNVAWGASREAASVRLPHQIETMAGPVMYADDVREALQALGLKVAP